MAVPVIGMETEDVLIYCAQGLFLADADDRRTVGEEFADANSHLMVVIISQIGM